MSLKARSEITSTRSGVVAVTVAIRGAFETSATSPKIAAAGEGRHLAALRAHLDRALEDEDETPRPRSPFAREHLPGADVELVGERGDPRQLRPGALREERDALDQLGLGVRPHARSLCPRPSATPPRRRRPAPARP